MKFSHVKVVLEGPPVSDIVVGTSISSSPGAAMALSL